MTRSADDETVRVPAGCPKHPVHRPCLRRTPGRDPTLERRSPEVRSGGVFRSNLASRSPRGERSARAFRIAIPWHDPATCGAAAMPRNHYAMADPRERFHTPSGFVISPSADPRTGAFAPAGCRVCPFHFGTEGHLASTTPSSPGGEAGRLRPHLSSCITREHHLASRSTLAESASPSARYETSSLMRAARRGLASSPTGARPIVSFR
jgi:hypothetical protein